MEDLWRHRLGRTGVQVLGEYFVTVTRKLSPGLSDEEAWSDVEDLFGWRPVPVDRALMESARSLTARFALSWWDAQIVAAALATGCAFLLTEDLQDGQDFDGITVVNPFVHTLEEIVARLTDEEDR